MKASVGIGAVGMVRIEKWSKSRGKEVIEFPNVVLRVGLEEYINRCFISTTSLSAGNSCFLGTGTTEPTLDDLGLEQVATATSRYYTSVSPLSAGHQTEEYVVGAIRFRYDWGEGEAAGTWTELGLAFWDQVGSSGASRGNANTYSFPFSRALIRDADGNPIALTVLPDEYLRVFYTLIGYIDRSIGASSVSFDGVPREMIIVVVNTSWRDRTSSGWRRLFHNTLPLWRGSLLTAPSGGGSTIYSTSRVADLANKTVVFSFNEPPGTQTTYNRVGLNSSTVTSVDWTWEFDPVTKPLEKNISGTLTATVTAKHWKILRIGKVASATATTLTMTGANWTPDQFAGMVAGIVAGTGFCSMSTIVSNTTDTLTISPGWHTMPIEGSLFEIREYDYE